MTFTKSVNMDQIAPWRTPELPGHSIPNQVLAKLIAYGAVKAERVSVTLTEEEFGLLKSATERNISPKAETGVGYFELERLVEGVFAESGVVAGWIAEFRFQRSR